MTNFEKITQDGRELAKWLSCVIDCDVCPARKECVEDEVNSFGLCIRLICEWLKRKVEI